MGESAHTHTHTHTHAPSYKQKPEGGSEVCVCSNILDAGYRCTVALRTHPVDVIMSPRQGFPLWVQDTPGTIGLRI